MLEEALGESSKQPAEVAQAMLSFVRSDLPNERFFKLVLLLCTRVFGDFQESKDKEFRHESGGWLSAQNRWKAGISNQKPQSYGSGSVVAGSLATPSIDSDPVVQLLGPIQPVKGFSTRSGIRENKGHLRSLIETMVSEQEGRLEIVYPFPFAALPAYLQRQLLLVLESCATVGAANSHLGMNMEMRTPQTPQQLMALSQNSRMLFGSLMIGPQSQQQVIAYQHTKRQARNQTQDLQLSPGLASPQSMTPPVLPAFSTSEIDQKETTPNLQLNMLEYYIFLFVRYPSAAPVIPRQPQSQANFGSYQISGRGQRRSQETPYGERVYCTLFSRYLRHFLPQTETVTHHDGVFPAEMKESELFLRTVIAFWLETSGSVLTTGKATQGIMQRFKKTGISHSHLADLNMSYDLTIGKFDPPPSIAQSCVRRLVVHVISDPAIQVSVMTQGAQCWCLSPAMTILQQPFFNYIRSAFRSTSIHAQGSVFYTALNAWLIWLEPWNVNHGNTAQNATKRIISTVSGSTNKATLTPSLTIPAAERKSAYMKSWEPYLAANLFLYTLPLAIFLRRARELDFSSREMSRSMRVVKRVFRVFTPEVVSSLENITKSLGFPELDGFGAGLQQLAVHHYMHLLGDYAPSLSGNLSLSSCQAEVRGMLEEIALQHMKRVRDLGLLDKVGAFLEGLFGHGVVSGEEIAIQSLVERAKTIVGLPIDYEIFSLDQGRPIAEKGVSNDSGMPTALRTSQGVLTDEGRRQLVSGRMKCNPQDIGFIGDCMHGRLKSHEIRMLVFLTNFLSNWLNKRFCLISEASGDVAGTTEHFQENLWDQNTSKVWRINLRWFADYRNLIFALLCFVLVWKIGFS